MVDPKTGIQRTQQIKSETVGATRDRTVTRQLRQWCGAAMQSSSTQTSPDEPTAALDSVRGRQVMELFRRIVNERRAAVVVVTPDRRSEELFDRTFELSDGRIAEAPGLRLTEASMGD
jgi:ABC-type hemin transport system ATPase subunit